MGLRYLVLAVALAWSLPAGAAVLTSNDNLATANANQRKIFRAPSGTLLMIYQKGSPVSTNGLAFVVSRDSGATWSSATQIDAFHVVYADALVSESGDVYLVYSGDGPTNTATPIARFARLAYRAASDDWLVEERAVVFQPASGSFTSRAIIGKEGARLWAAFRLFDGSTSRILVRYSDDLGRTWADSITVEPPGSKPDEFPMAFVPVTGGTALVYYRQDAAIRWRARQEGDLAASWGGPVTIHPVRIHTESPASFLVDADHRLHMLYASKSRPTGIHHTSYDGTAWSAPTPLSANSGDRKVSAAAVGERLLAVWQEQVGASQYRIVFRSWDGLLWGPAQVLSSSAERPFDRVWCGHAGTGSLTDCTVPAGDARKADVFSQASGATVVGLGDALYLGLSEPFDYVRAQIETKGSGGRVAWQYWAGAAWKDFSPASGAYHFTGHASVLLWSASAGAPSDWAPVAVSPDGASHYYVRAVVTTPYTTAPVATQVTGVRNNHDVTAIADAEARALIAWTSGVSKPFAIELRTLSAP